MKQSEEQVNKLSLAVASAAADPNSSERQLLASMARQLHYQTHALNTQSIFIEELILTWLHIGAKPATGSPGLPGGSNSSGDQ